MWKFRMHFIFIILALLAHGNVLPNAVNVVVPPANGMDHGSGSPGTGPLVNCVLTTGNCSGTGGGSALFTAATCNGVVDDSAAFASFNSWAVGTWQSSHSGQIQLTWPASSTCVIGNAGTVQCSAFVAVNSCPFVNIKNLLIQGNNGRLNTTNLGSLGGLGIIQDNAHSARTASANKGDTCASLITPAQASLFSTGAPVMMGGFDLQSIWKSPFGFPPNLQFFDHLHVASVDASHKCDGITAGASVHFTTVLSNQYLSTWPNYNSGNAFQVDPGGPATLYALDPSWDAIIEVDNLTIDYSNQIYAKNDTIIYNNVVFTHNCAVPSENNLFKAINTNFGPCIMEADKLVESMVTQNVTAGEFQFQSPSPKLWTDTGSTFSSLQGTPLVFTGTGTTVSSVMKLGAIGYGRSNASSCTNCSIASLTQGGINDNGLTHGVQNTYSMSGGVINVSNGALYTSVVSNGGAAQLVVDSSAGWTTGQYLQVGPNAGVYGGVWQVTVDNPTHMTLVGSTFTITDSGYICSAGSVSSPNCPVEWAAPGSNIMFVGTNGIEAIGQVTAVTQDASQVHIATTGLGSSFPSDVTAIITHPAPIFNCSGCTGADAQIASLAQAPLNAPLYSYQTYTYPGTIGTTAQAGFMMWGALSLLEMNVTSVSTSATIFHLTQFDNWAGYLSGSTYRYNTSAGGPAVDAHTSGDRKVNASGTVTCNGSGGACSGSDVLTTPSGVWLGGGGSGIQFKSTPSAGASITVTVQTNQGVVNP